MNEHILKRMRRWEPVELIWKSLELKTYSKTTGNALRQSIKTFYKSIKAKISKKTLQIKDFDKNQTLKARF